MVLLRYIVFGFVFLPFVCQANYSLRVFAVGTSHTGSDGLPPDDNFYGVHEDGYMVLKDSDIPSRPVPWRHSYIGEQTILSGSQNSNPPPYTPFAGVRFLYSIPVYEDAYHTNDFPQFYQDNPQIVLQAPPNTRGDGSLDWSGVSPAPQGPLGGTPSSDRDPVIIVTPQGSPQFVVQIPNPETGTPSYVVVDPITGETITTDGTLDGWIPLPGGLWYNPSTGAISDKAPDGSGGGSTNLVFDLFPVTVRLDSVIENQNTARQLLIDKLGGSGQSWVYDCKLSLEELQNLAYAIGGDIEAVKNNTASINSSVGSVKSSVDHVKSSVDSVVAGVAGVNSSVRSVKDSVDTLQGITLSVADNVATARGVLHDDNEALRQQLINQLGAAGNSWVYDCKLSLDELKSMAASLATADNQEIIASSVSSSSDSVKSSVDSVKSSVDSVKTAVDSLKVSLETIADNTTPSEEGSDIPASWPVPDFGNYNLSLPVDISNFDTDAASVESSLNSMIREDGSFNPASTFSFSTLRDFLKNFVGSIPSVGTDPVICSVEMDLPFIGGVSRTWSWDDFPGVQSFRAAMVWLVYLFFGLASFKVIHRSLI